MIDTWPPWKLPNSWNSRLPLLAPGSWLLAPEFWFLAPGLDFLDTRRE
jgi:hypothetical protein